MACGEAFLLVKLFLPEPKASGKKRLRGTCQWREKLQITLFPFFVTLKTPNPKI
jgi:hypothetical protein